MHKFCACFPYEVVHYISNFLFLPFKSGAIILLKKSNRTPFWQPYNKGDNSAPPPHEVPNGLHMFQACDPRWPIPTSSWGSEIHPFIHTAFSEITGLKISHEKCRPLCGPPGDNVGQNNLWATVGRAGGHNRQLHTNLNITIWWCLKTFQIKRNVQTTFRENWCKLSQPKKNKIRELG